MSMELLSLVTKVIIICFSIIGLYYKTGLREKKFKPISFIYFTNLNLVFCLLFFVSSIFIGENQILNNINGFILLSAIGTMVIYHFVLVPIYKDTKKDYEFFSFSDMTVHYVVPLIVIIHWILFAEKGQFSYYYPFIWLIPFLIYVLLVIVRAQHGALLQFTKTRYPYYFIDADKLGVKKTSFNIIFFFTMVIIIGYVLLCLDFLLNQIHFF